MTEKHIAGEESKRIHYAELEEYARGKIREPLQDLLEQEVIEWLGRHKSERKVNPLEQPGYPKRVRQAAAVHDELGNG